MKETLTAAMSFTIVAQDPTSPARAGLLHTPHGPIATPIFMPVGTRATVKALSPQELKAHGTQIVLGNTYHLYLQPGHELIQRHGGLHRFMAWDKPILTDSGGFQVFSLVHGGIANEIKGRRPLQAQRLPSMVKVKEEGVVFRSYLDGSFHTFTPERSILIQHALGADLILCFDELPSFHDGYEYTAQSMERTHRWAKRCLDYHQQAPSSQALFGIVHGGVFPNLRQESAEYITSLPFEGVCIGGSLGGEKAQMYEVVDMTVPHLPAHLPRHLLGVGDVDDLLEGVKRGIDLFDCVSPTRLARHKTALIRDPARRWHLNVTNAALREDDGPLQEGCPCQTCQTFSRAYIHHLYRSKEILGIRLVSLHNVAFLLNLMEKVRNSLLENRFPALYQEWLGDK